MSRDRDVLVPKHPRAPDFVEPEATGQYEGEELARIRARRPTDERIARLETKHDSLVRVVGDFRADIGEKVGEMSGKLDTVLNHVTAAHREQQATERVRIGSRAKMIVGVAAAIGTLAGVIATALVGGCS